LTFQCEKKITAEAVWVVGTDPTIHVPLNYSHNKPDTRIAKISHERCHTVLRAQHSGMPRSGEISFGVAPDDPNTFTFAQAINNAYCYEWLVTALQPTYNPAKARLLGR
jgi:hypothetical protein